MPVRFLQGSPCYLGLHANVAVSVLREASVNAVSHPVQLFSAALKLTHEKSSRVRPCVLELFRPQVFLLILLTILAYHATGLSVPTRCPHVYQCFRFLLVLATGLPRADLLVLSPRVVAGRNIETTESCGHDVGDVGVVGPKEPVDKPGDNDRYVVFRAGIVFVCHF